MTATCIGRHDTDPPLPEPGLLLCRRCYANLAKDLAAIASLWVHLADVLVPDDTGSAGFILCTECEWQRRDR